MSALRDDEAPLSLHHWAVFVREHPDHKHIHYYIVFCNHRGTAFPDYLPVETDGTFVGAVTLREAYGRDPGDQFDGLSRVTNEAHVSDAFHLVVETDRSLRTGEKSAVYAEYQREREMLNRPMGTSGAMGQYGHGMTPTNGVVGGMGHHNTMTDYGHGMTPSNNVAGSGPMNHYGHTMNHYGHTTFRDMGTGMY
jgi:hypothetical protein